MLMSKNTKGGGYSEIRVSPVAITKALDGSILLEGRTNRGTNWMVGLYREEVKRIAELLAEKGN
jgi:hypothetical protein